MAAVFLQGSAPVWLLLHAVVGFAVVGAVTHLAVHAVALARSTAPGNRGARIFGVVLPALFLVAFAAGLLLYPDWRVQVRGAVLDVRAPAASALFELKEHLAALALPLVLGAAVLARRPDAREVRWMAAPFAVLGATLVWVVALLGLFITAVRAVGGLP